MARRFMLVASDQYQKMAYGQDPLSEDRAVYAADAEKNKLLGSRSKQLNNSEKRALLDKRFDNYIRLRTEARKRPVNVAFGAKKKKAPRSPKQEKKEEDDEKKKEEEKKTEEEKRKKTYEKRNRWYDRWKQDEERMRMEEERRKREEQWKEYEKEMERREKERHEKEKTERERKEREKASSQSTGTPGTSESQPPPGTQQSKRQKTPRREKARKRYEELLAYVNEHHDEFDIDTSGRVLHPTRQAPIQHSDYKAILRYLTTPHGAYAGPEPAGTQFLRKRLMKDAEAHRFISLGQLGHGLDQCEEEDSSVRRFKPQLWKIY